MKQFFNKIPTIRFSLDRLNTMQDSTNNRLSSGDLTATLNGVFSNSN